MFGGAALGDERIVVRPVGGRARRATAGRRAGRRAAAAAGRCPRRAAARRRGATCRSSRPRARRWSSRDRRRRRRRALLGSRGDGRRARPVQPGDVAVLVRTNDQARHGARRRSRPWACRRWCTGTASVFGTPPRADWLTLLEALEQPHRPGCAAAALTCFLGRTVAELCGPAADALLDELGATVRALGRRAARARGRGAARGGHHRHRACPRGCSRRTDGERRLTDLRHVAQALHAAAVDAHLGPARAAGVAAAAHRRGRRSTSGWSAAGGWSPTPPRCRSSPCTAARAWSSRSSTCRSRGTATSRDPDVPLLHDGTDAGARRRRGERRRASASAARAHRAEEAGEDLRLLYVALTRAQCQVVTVVGAVHHHRRVAAAPAALRAARAGHGARR